jgi:hypothetical protein
MLLLFMMQNSHMCVVTMFVFFDVQTLFRTFCVVVCAIYVSTKFHTLSSGSLLVLSIEPKLKAFQSSRHLVISHFTKTVP